MPIFSQPPPLSLYIHLPWCVQKCPYCDFNSHQIKSALPEKAYVNALLHELDQYLPMISERPLISIFFGGGTPSLFSAHAIHDILEGVFNRINTSNGIEITLEANPGTVDQAEFKGYRAAGINRLSLGIQSLQNDKLRTLGRIHDKNAALQAIEVVKEAGFDNFNLDIMYGLPHQSIDEAIIDIQMALSCQPTHFSWYQLTIEPNTFFYHQTPPLPIEDVIWEMQKKGQEVIKQTGFSQYEVSAYAANQQTRCQHNLNYWEFGDYLGIGAGAHSKITDVANAQIMRFSQVKHPRLYLTGQTPAPTQNVLTTEDLIFEFMLNALRLTQGVPTSLFTERTGLPLSIIENDLLRAKERGLLMDDAAKIKPTNLGHQFLNDLVAIFLPKKKSNGSCTR